MSVEIIVGIISAIVSLFGALLSHLSAKRISESEKAHAEWLQKKSEQIENKRSEDERKFQEEMQTKQMDFEKAQQYRQQKFEALQQMNQSNFEQNLQISMIDRNYEYDAANSIKILLQKYRLCIENILFYLKETKKIRSAECFKFLKKLYEKEDLKFEETCSNLIEYEDYFDNFHFDLHKFSQGRLSLLFIANPVFAHELTLDAEDRRFDFAIQEAETFLQSINKQIRNIDQSRD